MSRAIIFENNVDGHRGYYASCVVRSLLEHGADVTFAGPANLFELEEGSLHFGPLKGSFEFSPLLPDACKAENRLSVLRDLLLQAKYQHSYIPYIDGMIQEWGTKLNPTKYFPSRTKIEGLMMRGAFAYPQKKLTKRLIQNVSLQVIRRSGLTKLFHLDPLVLKSINSRQSRFGNAEAMPEAITAKRISRTEARQTLGLSDSDFVIVCPGQVTERKGVDLLLKAIEGLETDGVKLVLIGRTSGNIAESLQSELGHLVGQRIVWENRFASELEFELLFSASNLVCLPYHGHIGSSSIALRAAAHCRRILSTDWGWLGWATENFDLGMTCDVRNQITFVSALEKSVEDTKDPDETPSSRRDSFLSFHTEENHMAHWMDLYCEMNAAKPRYRKIAWKCQTGCFQEAQL